MSRPTHDLSALLERIKGFLEHFEFRTLSEAKLALADTNQALSLLTPPTVATHGPENTNNYGLWGGPAAPEATKVVEDIRRLLPLCRPAHVTHQIEKHLASLSTLHPHTRAVPLPLEQAIISLLFGAMPAHANHSTVQNTRIKHLAEALRDAKAPVPNTGRE